MRHRSGSRCRIQALHLRQTQVPGSGSAQPQDPRAAAPSHGARGHEQGQGPARWRYPACVSSWNTLHSGTQDRLPGPEPTGRASTPCGVEPADPAAASPSSTTARADSRCRSTRCPSRASPRASPSTASTRTGRGASAREPRSAAAASVTGHEIQVRGVWTTYANKSRMPELAAESYPAASDFRDETLLLVGTVNPNLSIGFCARLYSSADLILPMNTPVWHEASKDYGRGVTLQVPYYPGARSARSSTSRAGGSTGRAKPLRLVGSRGFLTGGLPARPTPSAKVFVSTSGPGTQRLCRPRDPLRERGADPRRGVRRERSRGGEDL